MFSFIHFLSSYYLNFPYSIYIVSLLYSFEISLYTSFLFQLSRLYQQQKVFFIPEEIFKCHGFVVLCFKIYVFLMKNLNF